MKSSTEQRIFKKEGDSRVRSVKSYRQVKAHQQAVYRDTHREVYREVDRQVYQVDQDSTEAANRERTYEVDRMVTETDFERRLPNTDDYRLQDISIELAEALLRAQTALARLNLVSITILGKLTC
jgi:hypothetical protein